MAESTTPFNWNSWLGTGVGVAGALYGQNQANNAISGAQQAQQTGAANAQAQLTPYAQVGTNAIQRLNAMQQPGYDLSQLPGYTAGLQETEKAANRALAARGQYGSGGAVPAIARKVQDYAQQQYGNEFNRLSSLLNTGQNAANAISGVNQSLGNSLGAAQIARGNVAGNTALGVGGMLSQYLGGSAGGSLAGALGSGLSSAGSGISDLWNNYFNQGGGYNADGSLYGSPYTGTGNTLDSIVSGAAGGNWGSGGVGNFSTYTPTQASDAASWDPRVYGSDGTYTINPMAEYVNEESM